MTPLYFCSEYTVASQTKALWEVGQVAGFIIL